MLTFSTMYKWLIYTFLNTFYIHKSNIVTQWTIYICGHQLYDHFSGIWDVINELVDCPFSTLPENVANFWSHCANRQTDRRLLSTKCFYFWGSWVRIGTCVWFQALFLLLKQQKPRNKQTCFCVNSSWCFLITTSLLPTRTGVMLSLLCATWWCSLKSMKGAMTGQSHLWLTLPQTPRSAPQTPPLLLLRPSRSSADLWL